MRNNATLKNITIDVAMLTDIAKNIRFAQSNYKLISANTEVGIVFAFLLNFYPLFVILLTYYYFNEFALRERALLFYEHGC